MLTLIVWMTFNGVDGIGLKQLSADECVRQSVQANLTPGVRATCVRSAREVREALSIGECKLNTRNAVYICNGEIPAWATVEYNRYATR